MGFRPLNIRTSRTVSHEAFINASSSPVNQLAASFTGAGSAEASDPDRRTTFALVKLEATAPVDLHVLKQDGSWSPAPRISLTSYDGEHVPMMFVDGIQIKAAAGVIVNALVIAVRT